MLLLEVSNGDLHVYPTIWSYSVWYLKWREILIIFGQRGGTVPSFHWY